jgi:hypothetical protein
MDSLREGTHRRRRRSGSGSLGHHRAGLIQRRGRQYVKVRQSVTSKAKLIKTWTNHRL